jgi:diaminohydroxyphosphoribosylaminopyrimidine deaminase/5-amino-6-(5-phosphoribosylamino)uracil reductase
VRDPNPLVAGRGLRALRRAGIDTHCGLMSREAAELNEDFFWWVRHGTPWVAVKLAMTLDGRIADVGGRSRWITSATSRAFVHRLRSRCDAVAVGMNTVRADNPRLTVRHVRGRSPARFVFATRGRVPARASVVAGAKRHRTVIVRAGGTRGVQRRRDGVEVWSTGVTERRGSVRAFLRMAGKQGITSLLVEGGQELAASFLAGRLVNRVYLFYGNRIFGKGLAGIAFGRGMRADRAITLREERWRAFGGDAMVTGIPQWAVAGGMAPRLS